MLDETAIFNFLIILPAINSEIQIFLFCEVVLAKTAA